MKKQLMMVDNGFVVFLLEFEDGVCVSGWDRKWWEDYPIDDIVEFYSSKKGYSIFII